MISPGLADFLLGAVAGAGALFLSHEAWEKYGPRNTPEEMDNMAEELRVASRRMLVLADICDRLANGEDPENIEMPEDVRASYEEWRKK